MTAHLYRHYGADGELLYVGVSLSAVARLISHRNSGNEWTAGIRSMKIVQFQDRQAALDAERKAIIEELPLHNKQIKIGFLRNQKNLVPEMKISREALYFRYCIGMELPRLLTEKEAAQFAKRKARQELFSSAREKKAHDKAVAKMKSRIARTVIVTDRGFAIFTNDNDTKPQFKKEERKARFLGLFPEPDSIHPDRKPNSSRMREGWRPETVLRMIAQFKAEGY